MATDNVDRVAVQRDALLVHALATRSLPADEVDIHDPVVGYLAAWVDWVDESVDDAAAFEPFVGDQAMGKDRLAAARTKKRNRAALIAGSTVAALVVSSGAAAAVTGDPFLVAKAPLRVLEKVNPFDDDGSDHDARNTLPEQTPDVAKANKLLANAQRAAAQGDTEKAQRLLDKASEMLGENPTPGQQARIDHIVAEITGDGTAGGEGEQPGDTGQPEDPRSQQHGDHGPTDKDPADKHPVDKDPNGSGKDKDPIDKDPADHDPADHGADHDPDTGSGDRGTKPDDPGGDQGKGQGSGKSETRPTDPADRKDGKSSGQSGDHGGTSSTP
ncbi:MAG TPA: hypothetical protein VFX15_08005 [Actinomycetes bacterium]|nr:hypothetical protein [Actinomycetes bacterium]